MAADQPIAAFMWRCENRWHGARKASGEEEIRRKAIKQNEENISVWRNRHRRRTDALLYNEMKI